MGEWYLHGYDTKSSRFSFWCAAILKHIRTEFTDAELGLLLIKYSFKSAAALLTNGHIYLRCTARGFGWGRSVGSVCLRCDLPLPRSARFEFARCSYWEFV